MIGQRRSDKAWKNAMSATHKRSIKVESEINAIIDAEMKIFPLVSISELIIKVKAVRGTSCQIVVSRRYWHNRRRR